MPEKISPDEEFNKYHFEVHNNQVKMKRKEKTQ